MHGDLEDDAGFVNSEQFLEYQQMPGTRDGEELTEPLHQPDGDRGDGKRADGPRSEQCPRPMLQHPGGDGHDLAGGARADLDL